MKCRWYDIIASGDEQNLFRNLFDIFRFFPEIGMKYKNI